MKQLELLFDQVEQPKMVSSPMFNQFKSIKREYPDALLLFRCGDFYEAYAQDANEVSRILGINTTHRSTGDKANEVVVMAGFPFHALDTYLPRLVRAGKRVAICDQLKDPNPSKMRREV